MSAPATIEPPPQPVQDFEPITSMEISGEPTPAPQPQPQHTPNPADPPPPPQGQPAPQPVVPSGNPLDDLFADDNPPPAPQDTPPPQDEPIPDGKAPAWYREGLEKQKTEFKSKEETLRQELVAAQQRADELAQQMEYIQKEVSLVDPSRNPDVLKVRERLDHQVRSAAKQFSPKASREFMTSGKELVEKYAELGDVFSDGYDDRHSALKKEVDKLYGADSDAVFRALPGISETVAELKQTVQNAADGSETAVYSRAESLHLDFSKRLDEVADATLSYSEELAKAGGFPPQNIIARLLDKSPEFKAQSAQIKDLLRNSLVPPRPLSKSALAALPPGEQAAAQQKHMLAHQANYQRVWEIIPLAMHALYALPAVSNMLHEKNIEVKRLRGNSPPPPNGGEPDHRPDPNPQDGELKRIERSEIFGV